MRHYPSPSIWPLRALIIAAHAILLAPWPLYAVTGFWLFAAAGVVFTGVLLALWPTTKADWNS